MSQRAQMPYVYRFGNFQDKRQGTDYRVQMRLAEIIDNEWRNNKFSKQDHKSSKIMYKWSLKWLDIKGLRNYLITKNCNYFKTKFKADFMIFLRLCIRLAINSRNYYTRENKSIAFALLPAYFIDFIIIWTINL